MKKITLFLTFSILLFSACKEKHVFEEVTPNPPKPTVTLPAPVEEETASPNVCALQTVQSLSVVQESMQLALSWESIENATGYDVYRLSNTAYWDSLSAIHSDEDPTWYTTCASVMDATVASYTKVSTCNTTNFTDVYAYPYEEYYYKIVPFCERGAGIACAPVWGYITTISTDPVYADPSQEETKSLFNELSGGTGGETYTCPGGSTIETVVREIVNTHCGAGTDIVFLVDNTGSMTGDIHGVQEAISALIDVLPSNCMVGAAFYRDNNVDTDWYGYSPLSFDLNQTKGYVNMFSAMGGGDTPESVYDGIYNIINDIA